MQGRNEKIQEQIREVVSRFIAAESNKTALITVSRVELEERGRTATIFITVMPESGEESALNFIKRKRKELKQEVKRHMSIGTIPFLDVAIDTGEKARQNIDAILRMDK